MKKKTFLFIGILVLFAVSYGGYLYNKPHKNIAETAPELTITAQELIQDFNEDQTQISTELINKVIKVEGIITTIEKTNESIIVILDEGIKCELNNKSQILEKGQKITVKGVYSGFDEMFNEISLIRCHLIN